MVSLGKLKEVKGIRGATYRLEQAINRAAFAIHGISNFSHLRSNGHEPRPSVTAVVAGRNDDYMPDFVERLQATIGWNSRYLAQETIFVEWNPPADRELLSPRLAQRFASLRAFVVSREIHRELCENSSVSLLEFHAKNVGIRRANSEWVVATNADAAFGPDAIRKILQTELSETQVWSAERIDIPWREGRATEIGLTDTLRYRRKIPYHPLGTGEFAFASKRLWGRAGGYDESLVRHRIGVDKRGVAQLLAHGGHSERAGIVFHLAHPSSCTESVQEHHGEWATLAGVPYENDPNWGLADREQIELAERVWLLK